MMYLTSLNAHKKFHLNRLILHSASGLPEADPGFLKRGVRLDSGRFDLVNFGKKNPQISKIFLKFLVKKTHKSPKSIYLSINTATPSRKDFEQAVCVSAIVSNKVKIKER